MNIKATYCQNYVILTLSNNENRYIIRVNHQYDVPYLAGLSVDYKTLYVDKNVPLEIRIKELDKNQYTLSNICPFLAIHEFIERKLMRFMNYDKAHRIANRYEHSEVKKAGFDPDDFQNRIIEYYYKIKRSSKTKLIVPDDLYLWPYIDSKDSEILDKMVRV